MKCESGLRYAAETVANDLELIARHNQERYADLTGSLLAYAALLRRALLGDDCAGCSMPGGRHWDTCPNRWDGRPTR